jgi:hypothetical protein
VTTLPQSKLLLGALIKTAFLPLEEALLTDIFGSGILILYSL